MTLPIIMKTSFCARLVGQFLTVCTLATIAINGHAADPDQSRLAAPAGDGWQMLSGAAVSKPSVTPLTPAAPTLVAEAPAMTATVGAPAPTPLGAKPTQLAMAQVPADVTPVVLPSGSAPAIPNGILTFSITPQDTNLRNALDRWLQQQGWQLAWKIDDDLPLEFNATFTGDFKSVLTQVMQATNHMRTPTRVCKHTNNVVRVVARAANCQE